MLHLLFTNCKELNVFDFSIKLNLMYDDTTDSIGLQQMYYKNEVLLKSNYVSLKTNDLCDALINLKDIRKKEGKNV